MKNKISVLIISLLMLLSSLSFPQSNTFTIEAYKQFLSTHQNMDGGELMLLHNAGAFLNQTSAQTQNPLYLDSVSIKLALTEYEKSLIAKNGFMVTDRLKALSWDETLQNIFHKDLPLFISTDVILHSLHFSYDNLLKNIEISMLIPEVRNVLMKMHDKIPLLNQKYTTSPEMLKSLEDVDLYLSIAKSLIGVSSTPFYASNVQKKSDILSMINSLALKPYPLFSENRRDIDFSQFTVRGHYTDRLFPDLAKYFQCMIWLGRTEFYLIKPKADPLSATPQTQKDIQRQAVDALLLDDLLNLTDARTTFDKIDETIAFFVGESDNVTVTNLEFLKTKLKINDPEELLDSLKFTNFQIELSKNDFAYQRILSQVLASNEVDSIVPASAFLLLGQRFIVDSYVFSQVVYDRIKYNNMFVQRMLPNSLDVLFSMGNDAAGQLLQPELEQYHYATNLASLRYLVDEYSNDFWKSSMYNAWLQAIRSLNPPVERTQMPEFMQTAAYWQSKMTTQLASWSQLRHDNLLYAKQSYSGGNICSYPYIYVEPFPQFYQSLKSYAQMALQKFQSFDFSNSPFGSPTSYFQNLYAISDTLGTIAEKELNNQMLTEAEKNFLLSTLYLNPNSMCGEPRYLGWIYSLFYGFAPDNRYTIADVHTAPTDEAGNPVGWVKHVGTGMFNLGVWIAKNENGNPTAFAGPAMSYYEYTTTNFKRLTDEEWETTYLKTAPRPSFVNLYLADSAGNTRGNGPKLLTSIEKKDQLLSSTDYLIAQNYPNPFNPSTIISFSLPEAMANQNVSLKIFNITGELVKTFFEKELPAGNYLTRWDGTNEMGTSLPSGVYLYKVTAGSYFVTGKMNLVK